MLARFSPVLLGASLAAAGCCGARSSDSANADLFNRTSATLSGLDMRYRSCDSYEDSGTVLVRITSEGSGRTYLDTARFETTFERASGGFRFRYQKDGGGGREEVIVWRSPGGPTRASSWLTPEVRDVDLEGELRAVRGITERVSWLTLPVLLGFRASFQEEQFRLDGSEAIKGERCWRLTASGRNAITIWISQRDQTLRRVFERTQLHASQEELQTAMAALPSDAPTSLREQLLRERGRPFVVETTIEYAPIVNRPIARSRFGDQPGADGERH